MEGIQKYGAQKDQCENSYLIRNAQTLGISYFILGGACAFFSN